MNTIPVTDKKFLTYLCYRGIRSTNNVKVGKVVTSHFENNETFKEVQKDYPVDKTFRDVMSAIHCVEEMLRTTM